MIPALKGLDSLAGGTNIMSKNHPIASFALVSCMRQVMTLYSRKL